MSLIRLFAILQIWLHLGESFVNNIIDKAIVSVQENTRGQDYEHLCTGVLVGKKELVLVAAHCIENKIHERLVVCKIRFQKNPVLFLVKEQY